MREGPNTGEFEDFSFYNSQTDYVVLKNRFKLDNSWFTLLISLDTLKVVYLSNVDLAYTRRNPMFVTPPFSTVASSFLYSSWTHNIPSQNKASVFLSVQLASISVENLKSTACNKELSRQNKKRQKKDNVIRDIFFHINQNSIFITFVAYTVLFSFVQNMW